MDAHPGYFYVWDPEELLLGLQWAPCFNLVSMTKPLTTIMLFLIFYRRGSNLSLLLDVSSLVVEPVCSVSTPKEVWLQLLHTSTRPLTHTLLQQAATDTNTLNVEYQVKFLYVTTIQWLLLHYTTKCFWVSLSQYWRNNTQCWREITGLGLGVGTNPPIWLRFRFKCQKPFHQINNISCLWIYSEYLHFFYILTL